MYRDGDSFRVIASKLGVSKDGIGLRLRQAIPDEIRTRAGSGRPVRKPKPKDAASDWNQSPDPVVPIGLPCAVEGCDKPALGDEYCSAACCRQAHGIEWGTIRGRPPMEVAA
jgi:hypothetical protein